MTQYVGPPPPEPDGPTRSDLVIFAITAIFWIVAVVTIIVAGLEIFRP